MASRSLPNVVDFDIDSLRAGFAKLGVERWRADQVIDWIYKKGVYDWGRMTNLPKGLRDKLAAHYRIDLADIRLESASREDGSAKLLLGLGDGELVETVYIPKAARRTVCVSTQVGCKFRCAFCASGQAGFFRNLGPAEIVSQVLRIRDLTPEKRLTNVVFMGIGEPLDNFDNLLKAIRALNHPELVGLGARRLTISTCGVVPKIKLLAQQGLQIELSISLHGANDAVRSKLMPVNRRWPVAELLEAAREYVQKTKRHITFEYILAEGLNASLEDAKELASVLKSIPCKINLIPLNPIPEFPYKRPTPAAIAAFSKFLNQKGIRTTVRFSSGNDINAACGQLRSVEMRKVNGG